MNKDVDQFIKKSQHWQAEIEHLRTILIAALLEEDLKWGKPCYASEGKNIAIIQPFKTCLGLMFFKGTLLTDPKSHLKNNGPNSQSARRLEFRSVEDIQKLKTTIKAFVKDAIEIEKSGQKVEFKANPEPMPEELLEMFKLKPSLQSSFKSLTPGRQRAYILHFSSAKASATRMSRIEKCMQKILDGKGINDR